MSLVPFIGRLPRLESHPRALWIVLVLLPPVAIIISLGTGRVGLTPGEVISSLLSGLTGTAGDPYQRAIVMNARLPRTLLAALSGAGLAASGAVLQGAFRNPLVGPQTIGVLTGAGFGGSLMIFLAFNQVGVMAGAFSAGLLATLAAARLARITGQGSILMLVLSGIVISSLLAALTTMLQYIADPERQLPQLVFWLMGSFSTGNMLKLKSVSPPIIGGLIVLLGFGFRLNVLSSGEEEAASLGVNVVRDRTILVIIVAVISAAVVSAAGIIGWVGLVAPHIARILVGPDHAKLIPASILIGASYLTLMDMTTRSLTAAELPIGAVTAIIGAPVFMIVLQKSKGRGWRHD